MKDGLGWTNATVDLLMKCARSGGLCILLCLPNHMLSTHGRAHFSRVDTLLILNLCWLKLPGQSRLAPLRNSLLQSPSVWDHAFTSKHLSQKFMTIDYCMLNDRRGWMCTLTPLKNIMLQLMLDGMAFLSYFICGSLFALADNVIWASLTDGLPCKQTLHLHLMLAQSWLASAF